MCLFENTNYIESWVIDPSASENRSEPPHQCELKEAGEFKTV